MISKRQSFTGRALALGAALLLPAWPAGATPPAPASPAPPTSPPLAPRDLGTLGGPSSFAYDVNAWGLVAGNADLPNRDSRATIWFAGQRQDLGTLGGPSSIASAVNDLGVVVGGSSVASDPNVSVPFVWSAVGGMRPLPLLPGARAGQAYGLNNRGQIVGAIENVPVLWSGGKVVPLPTFGGNFNFAKAVNERGQIVGSSTFPGGQTHGVLWQDGALVDLGTLGGEHSQATAIDAQGRIVGAAQTAAGEFHATLWRAGGVTDLGSLVPGGYSVARDIASNGVIVGEARAADGRITAVIWQPRGGGYDGPTPLERPAGASEAMAFAVNARGQVAGVGLTGLPRAFLWSK